MPSSSSTKFGSQFMVGRLSALLLTLIGSLSPQIARADWGENWGTLVWGEPQVSVPMFDGWALWILVAALVSVAVIQLSRRRGLRMGFLVSLVMIVPIAAYAATIGMPNTFANGTPADADAVNANFDVLVVESNDQNIRLDSLELAPTAHLHPGGDITSPVANAVDADTVDGAHAAALEESAEIDADISTHDSNGAAHTALQRRVNGTCAAGSSIRVISSTGTVTCEADADSGGDITAVNAGTGLGGGGTSGNVDVRIDVPLALNGNDSGYITSTTNSSISTNASAVYGLMSSTSPGDASAAVRGQNNGTAGNGIGVYGSHAGAGWGVYGTATGAGRGVSGYAASGTGLYGQSSSSYGIYGTSSSGTAGYFTSSSGYGLVVPNGNVGFGTLTPSYPLHLYTTDSTYGGFFDNLAGGSTGSSFGLYGRGDARTSLTGSGRGAIFYGYGGSTSGLSYGSMNFASSSGASTSYAVYANATLGTTTGREIAFYGIGDGYFSNDVSIGTSTPNSRLHVNGDGVSPTLRAQVNGSTKFIVDSNGHVGIGSNTTPTVELHVKGGGDASLSNGSGYVVIGAETGINMVIDNNEIMARNNGLPSKLYLNKDSTHVVVPGLEITGGADLAEPFDFLDPSNVEPGMVVGIDRDNPGFLRLTDSIYDRTVAGIISGANGINAGLTLNQAGSIADGNHPVALTGRVYAWADASDGGAIEPGDLLTTSATPGHLMKVEDYPRAQGAILGKAMTSLEDGKGMVLVLVTLQ